jgi:hypothetical protein
LRYLVDQLLLSESEDGGHVPVQQLVHLKVLVIITKWIVEGLRHLQPSEVEQELQAKGLKGYVAIVFLKCGLPVPVFKGFIKLGNIKKA